MGLLIWFYVSFIVSFISFISVLELVPADRTTCFISELWYCGFEAETFDKSRYIVLKVLHWIMLWFVKPVFDTDDLKEYTIRKYLFHFSNDMLKQTRPPVAAI